MDGWMVGWMVGWLVGWLVGCFVWFGLVWFGLCFLISWLLGEHLRFRGLMMDDGDCRGGFVLLLDLVNFVWSIK